MILKGSQRGNAAQLARHLLNIRENEHVELHELRGFASEGLLDALNEVEAVARGTRCRQSLFSLSLSPPEGERVDIATFETAIEMVEIRLGLEGQGFRRARVWHVRRRKMTKRNTSIITLELDAALTKKLAEVADFEGKNPADTLRLLIKYAHADMRRLVEKEFRPGILLRQNPDDDDILSPYQEPINLMRSIKLAHTHNFIYDEHHKIINIQAFGAMKVFELQPSRLELNKIKASGKGKH